MEGVLPSATIYNSKEMIHQERPKTPMDLPPFLKKRKDLKNLFMDLTHKHLGSDSFTIRDVSGMSNATYIVES